MRSAAKDRQKQAREKIGNKKFCPICMEEVKIISNRTSLNCSDCAKRLSNGETAIVSMDGRHLFIKSDGNIDAEKDLFVAVTGMLPENGWAKDFTIAGKTIPAQSAKIMDYLLKMEKKSNEQN